MSRINIYENRHTAIISIKDRVDMLSAIEFRNASNALFDQGVTHFIIDLSQTPMINSAFIAVLVGIFKRSRQVGGYMKLVKAMPPATQRILHLTRFDQIFEMIEQKEVEHILSAAVAS